MDIKRGIESGEREVTRKEYEPASALWQEYEALVGAGKAVAVPRDVWDEVAQARDERDNASFDDFESAETKYQTVSKKSARHKLVARVLSSPHFPDAAEEASEMFRYEIQQDDRQAFRETWLPRVREALEHGVPSSRNLREHFTDTVNAMGSIEGEGWAADQLKTGKDDLYTAGYALARPGVAQEIYGAGGDNRWLVHQDGTVELSGRHLKTTLAIETVAKVLELGFGIQAAPAKAQRL